MKRILENHILTVLWALWKSTVSQHFDTLKFVSPSWSLEQRNCVTCLEPIKHIRCERKSFVMVTLLDLKTRNEKKLFDQRTTQRFVAQETVFENRRDEQNHVWIFLTELFRIFVEMLQKNAYQSSLPFKVLELSF